MSETTGAAGEGVASTSGNGVVLGTAEYRQSGRLLQPTPTVAWTTRSPCAFGDLQQAERVRLGAHDGRIVKARVLSGQSGLQFWRNSQSGALEAIP
ncbi:hypothetical protein [Reyranella sp.]|uniref:hypothetical protein n=1 Tax=Reyranella sp. TaxID=1929291 RepID=UPI003D11D382